MFCIQTVTPTENGVAIRVGCEDGLTELIERLLREEGDDERVIEERRIFVRAIIRSDEEPFWSWSSFLSYERL